MSATKSPWPQDTHIWSNATKPGFMNVLLPKPNNKNNREYNACVCRENVLQATASRESHCFHIENKTI